MGDRSGVWSVPAHRWLRALSLPSLKSVQLSRPMIAGEHYLRLVIPPEVSEAIARMREAVATKNRKRGARKAVQTRAEGRGNK